MAHYVALIENNLFQFLPSDGTSETAAIPVIPYAIQSTITIAVELHPIRGRKL